MLILGVVPARGGSKGVPQKNIHPLLGKPLIAYTIDAALQCSLITDVVCTTEDADIRRIALKCGAQVPFLRPMELATDSALAIPTVKHAVRETERIKRVKYDYVIMLQPTAPLRTSEDLTTALDKLINSDADGIISVVEVDNWHPMKMKKLKNEWLTDFQKPPVENPPRQVLPKVYMVNGAIYATKRDTFVQKNTFKGDKCLSYLMPPESSVNIDREVDFLLAEYYLRTRTDEHVARDAFVLP